MEKGVVGIEMDGVWWWWMRLCVVGGGVPGVSGQKGALEGDSAMVMVMVM